MIDSPTPEIVAQHTPGPWKIGTPSPAWGDDVDFTVRAQDGEAIAWVIARNKSEADTRLIAAAPELLAALQEMMGVHGHMVTCFPTIRPCGLSLPMDAAS